MNLSAIPLTASEGRQYVGRLAPSPTGALHLGNVRTFMIAYLRARSQGGKLIMRMEDLDHPRDKPGAAQAAIEDLKWLGFDWDEEYVQSERRTIYRQALASIRDSVYPCTCTRKDVIAAQSAPHDGEQLRYPGTCRGRHPEYVPGACWRFLVPDDSVVEFDDGFAGHYIQDVGQVLGDFPLARDQDGAGYTFAATLDDILMGVTEVVRGDDLLPATPAQILLARRLLQELPSECRVPTYFHVPLVVGSDGRRLAKRHGDTRVATYREQGILAETIIGYLASSCGWAAKDEKVSLKDLVARFEVTSIPHAPLVFDVFE